MYLLLKVLLTEHRLMERNYAALQEDFASCQGELAARCDDLEVLRDAHAAAEAQVAQQSQDLQVSARPHASICQAYVLLSTIVHTLWLFIVRLSLSARYFLAWVKRGVQIMFSPVYAFLDVAWRQRAAAACRHGNSRWLA